MKKILLATIVVSLLSTSALYAAETYTERFIQKHTQKIVDKEKELHSDVNVVSPLDNLPTNPINDTNDINDINKINLYEYDVYYDSKFISDFKVGNKTYKKGTNFNEEILNEIYSIEPNKLKDLVNVLE